MDVLAGAAETSSPPAFLAPTVALLDTAAVIGYLSVRLRVVPIVGFLLAGVLIGPAQLGLVDRQESVEAAAEVGVILLLFTIGIEFSLQRLARIRTWILVGCCDSSPHRHARGHGEDTGHPLVASLQDGETWAYCYLDGTTLEGRGSDGTHER